MDCVFQNEKHRILCVWFGGKGSGGILSTPRLRTVLPMRAKPTTGAMATDDSSKTSPKGLISETDVSIPGEASAVSHHRP